MKNKIVITLLILFALLVAGAGGFYFVQPQLFNTVLVGYSPDFTEARKNIFISNDTPQAVRDSVLIILKDADIRVSRYWQSKLTGNPVIIFCYTNKQLKRFSDNHIVTYKTPLKNFIIFDGSAIDLDMVSHEMFHTEFAARTGYFKNTKIPVWFDEGLAMQVDYRKEYSEEQYYKLKDSAAINISMKNISQPGQFYSGDMFFHFVFARHEVAGWIKEHGKKQLFNLVSRIKQGEEFSKIYGPPL